MTEANRDAWVLVNDVEWLSCVNFTADNIEGAVADSWTVSDDGLTYNFHLRPGIKFSNGSSVTTDDIVFSLELSKKNERWTFSLDPVATIEKVDESNVKVTLKEKSASFLAITALLSNGAIFKPIFEAKGYDEYMKNLLGIGPFMVEEWVLGDHITLVKNLHYWNIAPAGQLFPYLDKVILRAVLDDTTSVLQVKFGDADATDAISWSQISQLTNDTKAEVKIWTSTQSYYIFLNNRQLLDDPKARQAMTYAIDREAMVQAVLFGFGQPASSFMPPSSTCWTGDCGFTYDLEKAKALIAESNYPKGGELTLEVPNGRVIGRDNAIMLKEFWKEIGINVTVNKLEGGLLSSEFSGETFKAISGYQWSKDVLDPDQQVQWFVVSPNFHSGWFNEEQCDMMAHNNCFYVPTLTTHTRREQMGKEGTGSSDKGWAWLEKVFTDRWVSLERPSRRSEDLCGYRCWLLDVSRRECHRVGGTGEGRSEPDGSYCGGNAQRCK